MSFVLAHLKKHDNDEDCVADCEHSPQHSNSFGVSHELNQDELALSFLLEDACCVLPLLSNSDSAHGS